jgi:predicted aldo/keto reductase-like oxidoreductase
VAGVPCEGEEWEKTLKEAGKSNHPFVQISLTLYKLCNFIDRETNSELLKTQLGKFKQDYPDYYKLIGFQDK